MEVEEFKKEFGKIADANGFDRAYGGWFKESTECIVVLDLQKSNFGKYYELNIKVFIQGIFGNRYRRTKDLVKKDVGDVFTRQPNEFRDLFDLENSLPNDLRIAKIEFVFDRFIIPFTNAAMSRQGIKDSEKRGEIFLLPAIKEQLYTQLASQ